MRGQGTFSALIVAAIIISCLYVIVGVFLRESEVTAVHSLVYEVVQNHQASLGKRGSVQIVRTAHNEWDLFVVLDSSDPLIGRLIEEAVRERYGCFSGFTTNGIYIECPYNKYQVIL